MSIRRLRITVELPYGLSPHALLNEGEAANLLGIARAALCQMRHARKAPPHTMNGCHAHYFAGDILQWKRRKMEGVL